MIKGKRTQDNRGRLALAFPLLSKLKIWAKFKASEEKNSTLTITTFTVCQAPIKHFPISSPTSPSTAILVGGNSRYSLIYCSPEVTNLSKGSSRLEVAGLTPTVMNSKAHAQPLLFTSSSRGGMKTELQQSSSEFKSRPCFELTISFSHSYFLSGPKVP